MSLPVWAARTGAGLDPLMQAYSQSIGDDAAYVPHDLAGSAAHVQGLRNAGLLSDEDADALLAGLRALHADWQKATWALDPALEDGHMNVEAELTRRLGDVAKRLHTGRSRNDQVATCLVLHARTGLADSAGAAIALADALAQQAKQHASTPWAARTHGMPAQPATLGFLLLAHAWRLTDAAKALLDAFDAVGESPLGAGAVAGSTLPLDPAHTARLLGLRPPRSALLATGTRDASLSTLGATAPAALACASLAQDLLDLHQAGALRVPDGFATGSSLMPHKRNPDALELARAAGRAIPALAAQAWTLTAGLHLGYHRDFQLVKPLQTNALADLAQTLMVLRACVAGATFDAQALGAGLTAKGLTSTDAAEALVAQGMGFRDAYAVLAKAHAASDAGTPLADALAQQGLAPAALAAAQAALHAEPARRATLGGPAPVQVQAGLRDHAQALGALRSRLQHAQAAVKVPTRLLEGT